MGRQRRTTAQTIAALSIGGMVVARALVDRSLADELRATCTSVALEPGGWNKKRKSYNCYCDSTSNGAVAARGLLSCGHLQHQPSNAQIANVPVLQVKGKRHFGNADLGLAVNYWGIKPTRIGPTQRRLVKPLVTTGFRHCGAFHGSSLVDNDAQTNGAGLTISQRLLWIRGL